MSETTKATASSIINIHPTHPFSIFYPFCCFLRLLLCSSPVPLRFLGNHGRGLLNLAPTRSASCPNPESLGLPRVPHPPTQPSSPLPFLTRSTTFPLKAFNARLNGADEGQVRIGRQIGWMEGGRRDRELNQNLPIFHRLISVLISPRCRGASPRFCLVCCGGTA